MENNNLTIWQRLTNTFGPHGLLNQDYPKYNFDKKELLRTQNKVEYEREKLQAQQSYYLSNQWAKIESNMYSQAVYYEPTRLSSVYDYESMEYTPEISTALDIYAEESTTTNEDGQILNIFSESKRIQSILTDLFINTLDINTNLAMWTRNTCKYGDNFIYLKLDPDKGIVGCQQLPNIEIQRIEPGSSDKSPLYAEKSEALKTLHFSWQNKNLEFQAWEIAHFRLLGDDRKLPYGCSMLEKARRTWKQLCVSENTKVWTVNGYKKIKDITKGEKIYSFDYNQNKLIPSEVKDCWNSGSKTTFNVRTKHNNINVTNDHLFLVWDGEDYTYKNITEIDTKKHFLVTPNIIFDKEKLIDGVLYDEILGITENEKENVWDLEVSNELHNFIGNGYVVHNCLAEDAMLIYRVSRAPERRVFKIFVGNMDDADVEPYVQRVANKFKREQIVDSKTGNVDMRFNQMAVDQDYFVPVRDPAAPSPIETLPGACISLNTKIPLLDGRTLQLSEIIDEWDNGNRNLWVYSCDPHTGELAPGMITWAGITRTNTDVLKITLDNGKEIISTPDHKFVHRTNGFVEAKDLVVGDSLMPFYSKETNRDEKQITEIWDNKKQTWVLKETIYNTKKEYPIKISETICEPEVEFYNHKITKIEILDYKMDTGTITVDGNELFHNYHTFAIDSGIFIKNSNLGEISDIEYIQRKLVTALRIPKAFLGFEEAVGDGKTLALQDIRFARTINRIQRSMVAELNKIAIIHLYLLGFEDEITNFTLGLTNPSTQSDLLKIDIWKEKVQLYKEIVSDPGSGIQPTSATWAKKHIFNFSDEDIRVDLQQQRIERAVGEELKATPLIIKKTGLFDKLDKLYGNPSGTTQQAKTLETNETGGDFGSVGLGGGFEGSTPLETSEAGSPPLGGETEVATENRLNNINLLVENDIIKGKQYINFDQAIKTMTEIEDEFKKID